MSGGSYPRLAESVRVARATTSSLKSLQGAVSDLADASRSGLEGGSLRPLGRRLARAGLSAHYRRRQWIFARQRRAIGATRDTRPR
jgi:hypothetical protein